MIEAIGSTLRKGGRAALYAAWFLLMLASSNGLAQEIQLSPAQQQMLNSLPPAQRQQALDAIRQLESGSVEVPHATINEPETPIRSDSGEVERGLRLIASEALAEPRSRIVINFAIREGLSNDEQRSLIDDPVLNGLTGTRLFVLDASGVLHLPGLEPVPLLGFSESDINRRLSAEPSLSPFVANVRILQHQPIGTEALERFGQGFFESGDSLRFGSPSSGPVPASYVLGPGDSVRIQLFGNVSASYEYEISREGTLSVPELGPISAAGMSYSGFRAELERRVRQSLLGTEVSVSMGQLRTIRVFVLGDANHPGSYVVSGLSTISSALRVGGGVSSVGTLRNVQLKRNGQVVGTLDVYDLLIRGDNSGDIRLQPGDAIFVPPIGKTVSVDGAVNRPAIYEVKRLTTAADLVTLAGGLRPSADAAGARLERIGEGGIRTVLSVDLNDESANALRISSGDTLLVPEILPEVRDVVTLAGHVYRPGKYAWRSGMRLSDLIQSNSELKLGADTEYALIRRERERGAPLEAVSARISAALEAPGSAEDVLLYSGDTVNVFSLELGRQRVVESLIRDLSLHASIDSPSRHVQISGNVRAPGVYPLESNMRISDLIRAGGNLTEEAYALEAELTRYSVVDGSARATAVEKIDLDAVRRGVESADVVLRENDYLIINRLPDWDSAWTVTLDGEVKFPGAYRVRRGETLAEVVGRAGGFTDAAFVEGAVFLRESLKEQEQQQIDTLARRLEADLGTLSLQSVAEGGGDTLSTGRALLDQLRQTEAVGRLVIDLNGSKGLAATDASTLELRDGDTLFIPIKPQVVSVLGETQQNTSHLFRDGLSREDYIELSGGLTRRADKSLIYVVRANGAVIPGNRSRWFGRRDGVEIRPGDTIVVPLNTDRMRPLTVWSNVTQILYQAAIAVAAVQTF